MFIRSNVVDVLFNDIADVLSNDIADVLTNVVAFRTQNRCFSDITTIDIQFLTVLLF